MLMTTQKISMIVGLIMMVSMGTSYAGNDAGMIKQTKGSAIIERGGQKLDAKPGSKVLVTDRIMTGADSSIGITLHDGTLLSAGSNSILIINKFVFDSTTNDGALDASLKRGTLAVVSGKLSKNSPDAVTYRTPTTILGTRGTEFVIEANSSEN